MPFELFKYLEKELKSFYADSDNLSGNLLFEDVMNGIETINKEIATSKNQPESAELNSSILSHTKNILININAFVEGYVTSGDHDEDLAYGCLFAAIKPINSFIANMENGKTLTDSFNDYSWINGYFGEGKEYTSPEGYVPGQYKVSSIQQALTDYVTNLDGMKKNYYENLKSITGDSKIPEETLRYQTYMLGQIVKGITKTKESLPTEDALDAHSLIWKTVNKDRLFNLSIESVMCDLFFDDTFSKHMNNVEMSGKFERLIKAGGEYTDAIKSLESEIKKFRLTKNKTVMENGEKKTVKADISGATPQQHEIFEKVSMLIQLPQFRSISFEGVYNDINSKDSLFYEAHKSLQDFSDKMLKFIKDYPAAPLPGAEDVRKLANGLAKNLNDLYDETIYNEDGIFDQAMWVYDTIKAIPKFQPELKGEIDGYCKKFEARISKIRKSEVSSIQETECKSEADCREIDRKLKNIHSLEEFGFDKFEDVYKDKFLKMASDPEYNRYVVQQAKAAITRFADNPGKSLANDNGIYTVIGINRPYNKEQIIGPAYKLYMLGKRLEEEHDKISVYLEKKNAKDSDIKVSPSKDILDLVRGGAKNAKLQDKVRKYYEIFSERDVIKSLTKVEPKDFVALMNGEKTITELTGLQVEKSEPVSGYDDKFIYSLTQNSGNFYGTNSKEYNDIGKALQNIRKKSFIGAQSKEDYLKLLESTGTYMMLKSSKPSTKNGQLRFNSAAKLTADIVGKVKDAFPEYREKIESFVQINMARSKVFRDSYIANVKESLGNILGKDGADRSYNDLSPEEKEIVGQGIKSIVYASKLEKTLGKDMQITGKAGTMEKINELTLRCSPVVKSAEGFMKEFSKDPASFIKPVLQSGDPDAVINGIKLENELKNGNEPRQIGI